MTTNDKPVDVEKISCEVCLKEVPLSEAVVSEAADYFVHFCEIGCYDKWKNQKVKPEDDETQKK